MIFLKIFGITLFFIIVAFAGLAIKILLKKNGRFPNTHVGRSKEMKKRGIVGFQAYDRKVQREAWHKEALDSEDDSSCCGCGLSDADVCVK
ncbi:MAG: hypothetical protein JJE45_07480 [Prolixibacteraceae bacterium]|nr:hypothetical protein [Prolixibacteraceae bacterium]